MFGTPRSDCAGCFVVYLAKNIVNFTKNQLFYKKKSGKNLVVSKKSSTFAPSNKKKTITTMKKRNIFRSAWAMVSLALIAFVCVEWHRQGCGVWSLIAAISFYGVLSAGLLIAVDDVIERR